MRHNTRLRTDVCGYGVVAYYGLAGGVSGTSVFGASFLGALPCFDEALGFFVVGGLPAVSRSGAGFFSRLGLPPLGGLSGGAAGAAAVGGGVGGTSRGVLLSTITLSLDVTLG